MPQFNQIARPVAQRPVGRHGFVYSIQQASLAAGALAIALSLPDASISTGANQTVQASAQTITLSAPPVVRFLPVVNLSGGQQTIHLSLPTATLSASVTLAAIPQTLTLSLPDVSVPAQGGSVPVPYRRPIAQRAVARWGPPSVSTTPETVFSQTLVTSELVLALSAPDAARTATATLNAGAQTLALSIADASIVIPTPGVSANPIVLKSRQVIRRRAIVPRPYIAQHGAIDAVAAETLVASASPAVVALSAPAATIIPGAPALASGTNRIALSLPDVSLTGGAGFLSTGHLSLALSLPDVAVTVGATTVQAQACVLTLSAQDIQANRVVALTPDVVALSLPAVAVSQAAVRGTGQQTIALSLPDVSIAVTAQTRDAGALELHLSLPDVSRTATMARQPSAVAIALSLPDVAIVGGPTTVQASPVVLAIRLNTPSVLGATSLPADTFEGTLQSRLPERTLASRLPDNTLEFNE